jgi:hypothetical protein
VNKINSEADEITTRTNQKGQLKSKRVPRTHQYFGNRLELKPGIAGNPRAKNRGEHNKLCRSLSTPKAFEKS